MVSAPLRVSTSTSARANIPGLSLRSGFGMSTSTPMVRVRGSRLWTTRTTLPPKVCPWYGSAVRLTGAPTTTRAMSRSGTSICSLTVSMSCSTRMPTEVVLVPADCALTEAPLSRLRCET